MNIGAQLKQEFDKLTKGQDLQEIELVCKLQDALINLSEEYSNCIKRIIHGSRSMVEFKVTEDYVKGKKGTSCTRELGDMLFVAVKPSENRGKVMFLQNKLEKSREPVPFSGDMLQLELLKFRPKIKYKGNFYDNLRDTKNPSVCSYGVFWVYDQEEIIYDMKYYAANILEPLHKSGIGERRTITHKQGTNQHEINEIFLSNASNLELFINTFIELQIGETVTNDVDLYNLTLSKKIVQEYHKMCESTNTDSLILENWEEWGAGPSITFMLNVDRLKNIN